MEPCKKIIKKYYVIAANSEDGYYYYNIISGWVGLLGACTYDKDNLVQALETARKCKKTKKNGYTPIPVCVETMITVVDIENE